MMPSGFPNHSSRTFAPCRRFFAQFRNIKILRARRRTGIRVVDVLQQVTSTGSPEWITRTPLPSLEEIELRIVGASGCANGQCK